MNLAALLLLDRFAKLADFVLEPGYLRFNPLILLVQTALVLKLHGEGGQVREVIELAAAPLAVSIISLAR